MKKTIAVILIVVLMISFSGCKTNGLKKYQATYADLFDTVTVITGYETDKGKFNETAKLIYDELKSYHELYDIYNDYNGVNNIKTINDNAGNKPVKVDKKIIDMLKASIEMGNYSNGMFNISMGSVLSIWHEAREYGIKNPDKAYLPDNEALENAAKHMNIEEVKINEENTTVYLPDKDMSLDVGGIGKGYAVEAVSELLREKGLTHYLIAVGGNIETVGGKNDDKNWLVGIENPVPTGGNDAYKYIIGVKDMTVVTSGSYERYYTVNGVRYHHIIDPITLYPKNTYVLVTVISNNSAQADALTTALFNMSQEDGLKLIEKKEGTEAYWLQPDGTEIFSSGFKSYIVK